MGLLSALQSKKPLTKTNLNKPLVSDTQSQRLFAPSFVDLLPVKHYLGDGVFRFREGGLGSVLKIKTLSLEATTEDYQTESLEAIYPIIFMDATVLKIKVDSVVKNVAVYIMLGVSLKGRKEIIGFWIGENESAKYWLTVLNDIKKRGVEDVLIFAIDGLNGFNQAIEAIYPKAEVQRCIVHQIRSSLRFVS